MPDIYLRFWSGLDRSVSNKWTAFLRSENEGDEWLERAIALAEVCEVSYLDRVHDRFVTRDLDLLNGHDARDVLQRCFRDQQVEVIILLHQWSRDELGIIGTEMLRHSEATDQRSSPDP